MDLNIDWNKVLDDQTKDPSIGAAPDGQYNVRITKAEATQSSAGNPMIKVTAEIIDGPYAGKLLWTQITFKTDSPGTMRMAIVNLSALGVDREWLASTNPSIQTLAQTINGAEAVADVDSREWQGQMRNNVKVFKPAGAAGGVPAPPVVGSAAPNPSPNVPPAPVVPPAPTVDTPPAPETPPAPATVPDAPATEGETEPF